MKLRILTLALALLIGGSAFARVNVNEASLEELDSLPGIGAARAQAIIDYRQKNGPFKSMRDLKKVPELSDRVVDGLKGKVSYSGATKLDAVAGDAAQPRGERRESPKPRPEARPAPAAPKSLALPPPAAQPVETSRPAAPAAPAMPGKPAGPAPVAVTPEVARPAVPASPARPAMPAGKASDKAPAVSTSKPASPALESSPARPAMPAAPAKPAMPARPATVN